MSDGDEVPSDSEGEKITPDVTPPSSGTSAYFGDHIHNKKAVSDKEKPIVTPDPSPPSDGTRTVDGDSVEQK